MTEEKLKTRVREIPLKERTKMCRKMIGDMCSKGRPPKMTIPVQWDDEDFFINTTLKDLENTIYGLPIEIERLVGRIASNMEKEAADLFLRDANDSRRGEAFYWNLRANILKDFSKAITKAMKG